MSTSANIVESSYPKPEAMQLDEMDLSMIRNMMLNKSPKSIAAVLNLPVGPVQEAIISMYEEIGIEYKYPAKEDQPGKKRRGLKKKEP